jgi:hypothetical protein
MESDSLRPGYYFLTVALIDLPVSAALPQSAPFQTLERLSLTSQECHLRTRAVQ